MTPVQRFLIHLAWAMVALFAAVVAVGLITGSLPFGLALSAISPIIGGCVTGIVVKAKAEKDKE